MTDVAQAQMMALLAAVLYFQIYIIHVADFGVMDEWFVYAVGAFTLAAIVVAEYMFGKELYNKVIA